MSGSFPWWVLGGYEIRRLKAYSYRTPGGLTQIRLRALSEPGAGSWKQSKPKSQLLLDGSFPQKLPENFTHSSSQLPVTNRRCKATCVESGDIMKSVRTRLSSAFEVTSTSTATSALPRPYAAHAGP